MNDKRSGFKSFSCIGAAFCILFLITLSGCSRDFWLTPDQQGQRLMAAGKYKAAADAFADPFYRGVALYQAGEFKAAVAVFSQIDSKVSHFNRGNALVMLGKYSEAVTAFDQALARQPDWQEAAENRNIARMRAERLEAEGGDMTGGKMGADEIVFDNKGDHSDSGDSEDSGGEGQPLSDQALQALWLRRVQTKPADFLGAKFAYQYMTQK